MSSEPGSPSADAESTKQPPASVVVTEPSEAPESAGEPVSVAAAAAATGAAAPVLLVDNLGDYLRAMWTRIRSGESGALPVIGGLVLIVVIFQVQNSVFLGSKNLVNLFVEAALFIMFSSSEIFALLLSEIDLSIGYVAGVGAFIIAELLSPPDNWPWWAAVVLGLLACAAIGFVQGVLITKLRLPSFIVTLGGLLFFEGLIIYLADVDPAAVGGVVRVPSGTVVFDLVNSNLSPVAGWIALAAVVAIFAFVSITRAARRRSQGLSAPPLGIVVATVVLVAAAGSVLVVICNLNRGVLVPLTGVPYVIPFVFVVILAWSWLLGRTRLGRYIYAIGSNPEAARRAGINVARVRTIAFMLTAFTAGLAGLVYESWLGSISVGISGGTYVLYAVAGAVIGGTSLYGGRGKAFHALLGGLVIAAVYNGLALLGVTAAGQYMATALVLIAAVTVDSVLRRRSTSAV